MVFLQYAFASAASTIVSGAVTGRCTIEAYFVYSVIISGFIYPFVVHWVWSEDGWLNNLGMVDFAGSGVIHMTGGVISLMGAWMLGPRVERFALKADGSLGDTRPMPPNNVMMQTLGVFILWYGWYGFNAGSTVQVTDGKIYLAAKVAVNTTLSAAAATTISVPIGRYLFGFFDLGLALNCCLAGLVAITAGCASVSPLSALVIGCFGAVFYVSASHMVLSLHIDDPLDAFAVHGVCGLWGVIATGIFSHNATIELFGVQLLGGLTIGIWASSTAYLVFKLCSVTVGLRVSSEVELAGIDKYEHGGDATTVTTVWSLDDILGNRATKRALMEYMKGLFSEESLEFLIDMLELFAILDIDGRLAFLSEECEILNSTMKIKETAWDLIGSIHESYITVGCDREVNIDSSLSKRITGNYHDEKGVA